MFVWANENWTRRWDGSDTDILMGQQHTEEDHENVFNDLLRYFKDSRYIKIKNKPVIIIYRPSIISALDKLVSIWRDLALKAGFDGIEIIATNSFGFNDFSSIGFDGIVEFPPHNIVAPNINDKIEFLNEDFQGHIYHYDDVVNFSVERLEKIASSNKDFQYFPCVMTGWDNEARKPGKGNVFHGCTPLKFNTWLTEALDFSMQVNRDEAKFVFVNAWNEWAEGTYLEPDRKFGYSYLEAVYAAQVKDESIDNEIAIFVSDYNRKHEIRISDYLVCCHIFYKDMVSVFREKIENANKCNNMDLAISLPNSWALDDIKLVITALKPRYVYITKNIGRDVWPFINLYNWGFKKGYKFGCKIHSKKSPHLINGKKWGDGILDSLLSRENLENILSIFRANPKVGQVAPQNTIAYCSNPETLRDNYTNVKNLSKKFGLPIEQIDEFVAGTMFWFRFDALKVLSNDIINEKDFGVELGAIDGTPAHAMERIFTALIKNENYILQTFVEELAFNPYNRNSI